MGNKLKLRQQQLKAKMATRAKVRVIQSLANISCFTQIEGFDLNKVEGHENYEFVYLLDRIEKIMEERQLEGEEASHVKSELPVTKFISTTKTSW